MKLKESVLLDFSLWEFKVYFENLVRFRIMPSYISQDSCKCFIKTENAFVVCSWVWVVLFFVCASWKPSEKKSFTWSSILDCTFLLLQKYEPLEDPDQNRFRFLTRRYLGSSECVFSLVIFNKLFWFLINENFFTAWIVDGIRMLIIKI